MDNQRLIPSLYSGTNVQTL